MSPALFYPVFENSSKIVIVMEYASRGDLYDYISERQRLSERDARHFFRQIVSAVHYCHQVHPTPPWPCAAVCRAWGGRKDLGFLAPWASQAHSAPCVDPSSHPFPDDLPLTVLPASFRMGWSTGISSWRTFS